MTMLDTPPASRWPDLTPVDEADRRVLWVIAALAVIVDLGVRSGLASRAGALAGLAFAAGTLASGRVVNRRAWPLLAAAPVFGVFLVARTSDWLTFLDVLAAAGLLLLGCSLGRAGNPFDLTVPDLIGRGLHALTHAVLGAGFVIAIISRTTGSTSRRTMAVLRGVLLAAPLVLVIGLLLASADPVFASFFRFPTDAGDVALHVVLLAVGGWAAAALLRLASGEAYAYRPPSGPSLGRVEALTVLGGLVAVFAVFTAAQVAAIVGGAAYVRRTAGLGYADYARSGFFQLLAVAVLTLAVLMAIRAMVRDTGGSIVVLCEFAVVLVLLVVAGSVRRLWLYEQAYGLTILRFASLVFALWIGGVFVLLGGALVGRNRTGSIAWFVPASLALGLVALLVVNLANPESVIVERNVERFGATDRLDVDYLVGLSDDAVPALVRALPTLRPEAAAFVLDDVCAGGRRSSGGFWGFNASRQAALDARATVCP